MFKSFILVSFRNLSRYKVSSAISSGSLALGMLFAFVIFKFTSFERSFDSEVPDLDQKVRLNFKINNNRITTVHAATVPYPYTDLFTSQSPEIQEFTRFYDAGEGIVRFNQETPIKTNGITFADESLLDFFGSRLVKGSNIEENDTRSVVISSSLAKQLFGTSEPMGQTISYLGSYDFVVKGIFEDLPLNSSVSFHLVGAMDFLQTLRPAFYRNGENWGGYSFHTFYKLTQGTDLSVLSEKFRDQYYQRFNITEERLAGEVFDFSLTPLADIHLSPGLLEGSESSDGVAKIRTLEYLAFIILIIAWINFINLQATKAPQRMKEVGVRKVFGAAATNLYIMFFVEFGFLNLISIAGAVVILSMINPQLSTLTTVDLDPSLFPIDAHPWLATFLLIGVILSSVYPAVLAVKNSAGLKSTHSEHRSSWFKKGLVTFQLAVSLFLIPYTLSVYFQVQHMSNQNPGFDTEKVLMINGPVTRSETNRQSAEYLKEEALRLNGVEVASWGGASPGINQGWQGNLREMNSPDELYQTVNISNITNDYFDVFDIEVLAGRIPLINSPYHEPRVVINEKSLNGWGWNSPEEAIGKRVEYGSGSTVVAVVENFHSLGFQNDINPHMFIVDPIYNVHTTNDFFLLKVDPRQAEKIVSSLEETYLSSFPGNPYTFSFLDKEFDSLYSTEIAYNKVFSIFSSLAIVLACIGMLGMARYTATERKKEIGIRKVLGAGELRIVRLFLREYIGLIALAFLIATPIAYYYIDAWLDSFAYRINIGPELFLLPLWALIFITTFTVGSISYRASKANPVIALKEL